MHRIVQVHHPTITVEEGVLGPAGGIGIRPTDHLAKAVDAEGPTIDTTRKSTQTSHGAVAIQESLVIGVLQNPYHFAGGVDAIGNAMDVARNRSQIGNRAVTVEESMSNFTTVNPCVSCHLARVVDRLP